MAKITDLKVTHAFTVPLTSLASRSLFQGATVARDPRDKKLYFWQLQVKEVGPGDIEDVYAHRFLLDLAKGVLTFKDTMIIKGAGHVQSLRVRISALGNGQLWMGCETYNKKTHKTTGTVLYRIMHRRGTVRLDGKSKNVEKIYTGSGNIQCVGSENPKTVWLRRPSSPEIYEEHTETTLRSWKPGKTRPRPIRTVKMSRGKTTYQSSCVSPRGEVLRINGATENSSLLTSSQRLGLLDFTSMAPPGLKVTSEEPEAVFTIDGVIYVLKRYNSVSRRVVSASRVSN